MEFWDTPLWMLVEYAFDVVIIVITLVILRPFILWLLRTDDAIVNQADHSSRLYALEKHMVDLRNEQQAQHEELIRTLTRND